MVARPSGREPVAMAIPTRADRSAAVPPEAYFVGSAIFHYLGPASAVLVFVRVAPLGGAWRRVLLAAVLVTHVGATPVDAVAIAAGAGVGISSSVIPYVFDQRALARLPRATYSLMVAILPATATIIGLVVLAQVPTLRDLARICLVATGVALHRPAAARL